MKKYLQSLEQYLNQKGYVKEAAEIKKVKLRAHPLELAVGLGLLNPAVLEDLKEEKPDIKEEESTDDSKALENLLQGLREEAENLEK